MAAHCGYGQLASLIVDVQRSEDQLMCSRAGHSHLMEQIALAASTHVLQVCSFPEMTSIAC